MACFSCLICRSAAALPGERHKLQLQASCSSACCYRGMISMSCCAKVTVGVCCCAAGNHVITFTRTGMNRPSFSATSCWQLRGHHCKVLKPGMQGVILAANRYQGEGRLLCFEMQAGQDRTTLHAVPCQQLDSDASAWAGSLGTGPNCNILITSMAPAHINLCCASGLMPEAAQHKVLGRQHSLTLPSLHTLTPGPCLRHQVQA